MFRDVRRHIRQCILCQKCKAEQRQQAGKMLTRQVTEPLAYYVQISSDRCLVQKREYHAPRLLRHLHQPSANGSSAISEPLRKLVCDNGSQFTSKARSKDFLKEMGVEFNSPPQHCPRENPTERANRTVKTMIAQYVENGQNTWDSLLPELSPRSTQVCHHQPGIAEPFFYKLSEDRGYLDLSTTV
ncbi:uncharacterized protein LOC122319850 [Drosophila ficusphila]|uniref:uncharacterized protein LOC122319850 n=1 Tax=Drosophila ficusphila TaxID=30025 RepID=UPI001C89DCD5|nr:uncharacterized protein LOC122319850 [Drosophila ficusphila]